MRTHKILTAAAIAAALAFTGCSASPEAGKDTSKGSSKSASTEASAIKLEDSWAKAGEGMTGVFGTLENSSNKSIQLVDVESPLAESVELHETKTSGASATMSKVEGGFEIPADGEFDFEPGGNHIMFMGLHEPLLAGDEVPLTLIFSDGSKLETVVLVKDFSGANENYDNLESGDAHGEHGDMKMDHEGGEMDHGSSAETETGGHAGN